MKSLLILIFCSSLTVSAQVLRVTTVDKMTEERVHSVLVSVSGSSFRASSYTNSMGVAYIRLADSLSAVEVAAKHVSFSAEPKHVKITRKDTISVTIEMTMIRVRILDEFVVRPLGTPKIEFQSERVSVDDFEFLPDGRLILLTYEKTLKKGSEVLFFDQQASAITLPGFDQGRQLVRDYRGTPHVIGEKGVYAIHAIGNRLEVETLDSETFRNYVEPIADTTSERLYFSNYSDRYPAFDYFSYQDSDSSYQKILGIQDDFMMELYRAEYKWVDVRTKLWAKEMENSTGVDAEIWVGASVFTQSIFYKELYAPLFEKNDTVYVFDHYKDFMFRFGSSGEKIDSIPIFYHLQAKNTGWKKLLVQDQTTGEIYSIYEKNGNTKLARINTTTGELVESIPLHNKYVQKLLIRDNKAYYTYRPFESPQKKYLYSEQFKLKEGSEVLPEVQAKTEDL